MYILLLLRLVSYIAALALCITQADEVRRDRYVLKQEGVKGDLIYMIIRAALGEIALLLGLVVVALYQTINTLVDFDGVVWTAMSRRGSRAALLVAFYVLAWAAYRSRSYRNQLEQARIEERTKTALSELACTALDCPIRIRPETETRS